MSWEFSFATRLHMTETSSGFYVPAMFSVADREVRVDGYFDVGAAYCVIPREAGEKLGLDIETGEASALRTGTGLMPGYLHYTVLSVGDLIFEDVPTFVAKYPDFDRCLLGRAGWLQKVRLNLVTYDGAIYLNLYDQ